MDTPQLTREIANSLLQPEERSVFIPAEQQRMWSRKWIPSQRHLSRDPVLEQLWGRPLMRSYDAISGSEPCPETHRMLARGPRMRLDTKEKRIKTLKTHTDHRIWEDTPLYLFQQLSSSPREIGRSPHQTSRKRSSADCGHRPTRSNRAWFANFTLRRGIEVLSGRPPYSEDYWQNHYLCLWEVTPAEVVGIWEWDELRELPNWYEDVIMPAVSPKREKVECTVPIRRLLESVDYSDDNAKWSGSDRSYDPKDDSKFYVGFEYESDNECEKDCEENLSGQLMSMLEDLSLHCE